MYLITDEVPSVGSIIRHGPPRGNSNPYRQTVYSEKGKQVDNQSQPYVTSARREGTEGIGNILCREAFSQGGKP